MIRVKSDQPRGELQAGELIQLGINVEAKQIGSFNCKLAIRIVGGDVIFLVLRGRVEQPELEIRPFDAESERLRE